MKKINLYICIFSLCYSQVTEFNIQFVILFLMELAKCFNEWKMKHVVFRVYYDSSECVVFVNQSLLTCTY